MNSRSSNNLADNQTDDKSMDNISQSSSPNDENTNLIKDEKFKISNESILSSSSSSSFASSFSPNLHKNFQSLKLDWYKQYEESWKFINQQRLTDFQTFIKPSHTNIMVPHDHTTSVYSDKFSQSIPPHHFLLAQYANIYGSNNLSHILPHLTNYSGDDFEKERAASIKQIHDHSSKINSTSSTLKDQLNTTDHRERSLSSNSGASSPNSSEISAQLDCDEDENLLDENQESLNANNGEWTYEEQFKQLYELSDDAKRKEFLDDLFSFMQKRGSPVNRIPIMAKHVLDLYELYRLVVSKGGLVEVINKKLWREITKGLNLPSSITSAAFTLRTQYMKYLYPYECEKMKMSTPSELQAAIDGNRREGRRPVYGNEYSSPPISSVNLSSTKTNQINPSQPCQQQYSLHQPHHQIIANTHQNSHHTALLAAAAAAAAAAAQHHNQTVSQFYENTNYELNSNINQPRHPNQPNIPNFQPFFKNYFEVNTPPSSSGSISDSLSNINTNANIPSIENETKAYNSFKRQLESDFRIQEQSSKKLSIDNKINENKCSKMNIKIYEKESNFSKENCLSVSLDYNGKTFDGILYPTPLETKSNGPDDFRENFSNNPVLTKRLSNKENLNCDFIKKGVYQKNIDLVKRKKIYSNLETIKLSEESSRNISKISKSNQSQIAQESVNKLCLKFRPPKISNLLKPTIRGLPMNININGVQEKSTKKRKTNLNMVMDWANDNSQKMDSNLLNNLLKENDTKNFKSFERTIENKSRSQKSNSGLFGNLKISQNVKTDGNHVLCAQSTGNQNEHVYQNLIVDSKISPLKFIKKNNEHNFEKPNEISKKPISNKYGKNEKSINDSKLTDFENNLIETYVKKIEEKMLCKTFKSVNILQKTKRTSKIPCSMNKIKLPKETKSDTIGSILDIPLPSENDAFSEYSFFVTNVFKKALEKQSKRN
ncbi:dead ringer -like protein [Brachionus plicatilis]|uniref:Dead ringer-like protein n=1 Tax=Brachionus plicatilis TaxID=10195 RepID=A0A3M7QYW0_BRAPC|nr:dead ringer -like protein [Brachionus plicatilis]